MITENGEIDYEIPDEIKLMFTNGFYEEFVRQIDFVFNKHNYEEPKTYWNFYSYLESSYGWRDAFRRTCDIFNLLDLCEYYDHLPWYDGDMFDDEFALLMVANGICEMGVEMEKMEKDSDPESPYKESHF